MNGGFASIFIRRRLKVLERIVDPANASTEEVSFGKRQAVRHRIDGALLGCVFLLVVPAVLLGPIVFGGLSLQALPRWAILTSIASIILGAWHLATSAFALEEDLEFITTYFQAQDAAPVVLPFALYVGTRSMYRRFFAPAYVARQRWLARRGARKQIDIPVDEVQPRGKSFPDTIPTES
ncbi:hypothetical protein ACEN8I_22160 [Polaromonas sp. CT11-55]|uniref:hypothetical protein n=1 Tax=Polaromonas sp. CT11-55 TaxID=3243045 RepID=UPI0039A4CABB